MSHHSREWEETFKLFHNADENGGSSRWMVTPDTVRIFIRALLDKERGEILKIAEDHYWDTFQADKDLIMAHLRSILSYLSTPST